jgi:2'-5' RNA ligase
MNDCCAEGQNLFTLVTYTPPPLRNWVARLRRQLQVEANSQPHITILPPRPLLMPVEKARQKITSILDGWQSFEIELSDVRVFPETNVLYLEVTEGSGTLRRLHAELGVGDFAHEEPFEFHPHVTIGGPVPQEHLATLVHIAADSWKHARCPCRFAIDEVAFVTLSANRQRDDWCRLWAHNLGTAKSCRKAVRAAVISQTF